MEAEEQLHLLEEAYGAYSVEDPFSYVASALKPSSAEFPSALLALVIAVLNDGAALLVGLFFETRRFDHSRQLSSAELKANKDESLRAAVMPLARKVLKLHAGPYTDADVANAFAEILAQFLEQFSSCPQLADEGFSRFHMGELPHKLLGILRVFLELDMIKYLNADEAACLGLNNFSEDSGGTGCLLLSIRGEAWLAQLIGAVEIDTLPDNAI